MADVYKPITKITNYRTSPYYDTFDERNNYHRVLFRPGYAVQARELTQLQTAFQAQIDRHGQHSFSDGAAVVGSGTTVDTEYAYIKCEDEFYSTVATGSGAAYDTSTYISEFVDKTIIGTDNTGAFQVEAKVLAVVANGSGPAHGSNSNDPITLYIKYNKSGGTSATNRTVKTFGAGEVFKTTSGTIRVGKVQGEQSASATEYVGAIASTNSALTNGTQTGLGSAVHIVEGVRFVSGCFTYVPGGTLILNKYNNIPSYNVGLLISEQIISSNEDADLVDNAAGQPNASAPGANRYKITCTLIAEPLSLSARTTANYFSLLRIENGITSYPTRGDSVDTELNQRFADRTFEESGNYTVSPFDISIDEYLNDGTNFGFKTTTEIIAEQASVNTTAQAETFGLPKLNLSLSPSTAYVKGKRIKTSADTRIIFDKPRDAINDVATANAAITTLPLGNYIKLTSSTIKGMPQISTMHTLVLNTGSIASPTAVGTARCRGIEKFDGTIHHLYIFDIVMTSGTFAAVTNVSQTNSGQETFVATLAGTPGAAVRYDSGQSSFLYKLPFSTIRTLKDGSNNVDTDYIVRAYMSGTVDSSGNIVLTCPSGGVLANDDDIQVAVDTNAVVEANAVASGVGSSSFTLNSAGLGSMSLTQGEKVQVVASIRRLNNSGSTRKTKTIYTDQTNTITANGSASYGLGKNDIIKIRSITDSTNAVVTNKFTLDNGQRENFYEEGNIILKGGESVPNGNLVVKFDYYVHSAGDYFCVDSYYDSNTNSAANTILYETIPTFNGVNGVVQLRDCLDFRPSKATTGATTGFEFSSGTNASTSLAPSPGTICENDIKFYLPRIDKILLGDDGIFKYVKGTSAFQPKAPEDVANSMTLYAISCNPYVFNVKDVKANPIDNKRYTMRDIGKLDKRIKNLEYYTSLSLLEKSAAAIELYSGLNSRFKNGFIVDGFYGHNIGNSADPDYSVSIDKVPGTLRPKFDPRSINLVRATSDQSNNVSSNGASNGVTAKAVKSTKGGIITMPHTTVAHITQPYSTYAELINPHNVFAWEGTMKLSPETDEWKEVDVRPDITIDNNSIYDQFVAMAEESGILGTVWDEWETNWTGKEINENSYNQIIGGQQTLVRNGPDEQTDWGFGNTRREEVTTTVTATTLTGTQSRSGLSTSVTSDTVTKEIGDYVVETNFIPFMRSRKISFDAELLKPETKLYAFFGGIDITAYCKQSAYSSGSSHVDADFSEFSDQTSVITYEGDTSLSGGGTLVSDSTGRCVGQFVIPRNDVLKFRTGVKDFKITDSSTNSASADTHASAIYYALGILETHQKTILATKVPRLVTREVGERGEDVKKTTTTSKNEHVRWIDPLAQTFVVDGKTNTTYTEGDPPAETGIFAKSLSLYFQAKDAGVPVQISIRSVENGYPTQTIVPGSEIVLYPSDINVSADASSATTASFDYPVYLDKDTEYAIILIANSAVYKVFVSDIGGFDLTDTTYRVVSQPYNGVFFTSANASTWTAEQTKDLKFILNRCSFPATGKSEIIVNNDVIPPKKLGVTPLEYLSNSTNTEIRVYHPNHGMYGSGVSKVDLTGFVAENGVTATQMNTTHTIKADSKALDSYVITLSGIECTDTGIVGGGQNMTATENQVYNVLNPRIQNVQIPGTSLTGYLTGKTGCSVDGSQTAFSTVAEQEILLNKNFLPTVPMAIAGSRIETDLSTGKGISLRIELDNGGNERISPVIDLNRSSLTTIQNRLNDPVANSTNYTNVKQGTLVAETVANGTSAAAKYITRKVELANEADLLDVYIGVNRPSDTNIDVYYKVQAAGQDTNFNTLAWIAATPENTIPINDGGRFSEAHYAIDPAIGKFSSFAIKIVLRSKNSSKVPQCSDFRAIATL
jgi:hypothetical protein